MKYLVLFMESDAALPIDLLDRRIQTNGNLRPQSEIAKLLSCTEPAVRVDVDDSAIDGYTTIDVRSHEDAVALAQSWKWTGGVKLLPMPEAVAS